MNKGPQEFENLFLLMPTSPTSANEHKEIDLLSLPYLPLLLFTNFLLTIKESTLFLHAIS